ncbi:MAG: gas vesicle protein K [Phycisphaerae bacterium]
MIQSDTAKTESQNLGDFASALESARPGDRPRLSLDPDDAAKGLGQLVLTLVELLRQLLERQALRRVDGGSLTEAEIERLGRSLVQLAEQMQRLKREFGLEDEDLNLDLGPLGRLL